MIIWVVAKNPRSWIFCDGLVLVGWAWLKCDYMLLLRIQENRFLNEDW